MILQVRCKLKQFFGIPFEYVRSGTLSTVVLMLAVVCYKVFPTRPDRTETLGTTFIGGIIWEKEKEKK